ncbi:MAG: hypothetical protein LBL79_07795 [Prevotella sp.]|jgi:hypothetical protein|nr:hypothetical protein [Prevotella sp.]
MEENIQFEGLQPEITADLEKQIKAKVKSLKDNDPKLKHIFPFVVFGNDGDSKEQYVGYFRQPTFNVFSKYLAASQSNNAVAMRTLAKDCFLAGDDELINDDSLFLFGLMGQLSKMIEMRQGLLVNLSKPGK